LAHAAANDYDNYHCAAPQYFAGLTPSDVQCLIHVLTRVSVPEHAMPNIDGSLASTGASCESAL
jgi:hypothetical protein